MQVEVVESPTIVVVEQSSFVVEAAAETPAQVVVEQDEVTVVAEPPEHVLMQVEHETIQVVPEVSEVRIIAVAEQGPPGAMRFRSFPAVWESELLVSWSDYDDFRVVLEGPVTTFTFDGATDRQRVILEVQQDDVGGRTIVLPGNVRYSAQLGSVTLSTEPGATDRLGFLYNLETDTYDFMAYLRGF